MINFPIGIQLYSVREAMSQDFEGTLRKIKDMGYDGVEFAGLYGKTPAEVKAICDELGLVPISAHVEFVEMMNDPEGVVSAYKEIGCEQIVIPYLTPEYRPGAERFGEIIEGAKLMGSICNKYGMKLAYHNHDFEFAKIDGEYALDILYKEVSADLLQTQLDTCWVNVGGQNPADYIRKYAGRTPTVHLKDFVGTKSKKMYELIGIDDKTKQTAQDEEEFCLRPVGYGKQNFPEILKASKEAGAKWVIVEQDRPSMDKTPLECAELSINYLKSL